MFLYISMLISSGVIAFLLGWILGKKKNSADMIIAIKAIANLKATIDIYKITHEEQMKYLLQKYTDLKLDVGILKEENKLDVAVVKEENDLLKEKIKLLKEKLK